jgi:hypothetical protein
MPPETDGEFGTGGPTVAGNPTLGFFYVDANQGAETVVRVTPGAKQISTVARLRSANSYAYPTDPTVVTLGRSLYFLDPPGARHEIRSYLHRVTLR